MFWILTTYLPKQFDKYDSELGFIIAVTLQFVGHFFI